MTVDIHGDVWLKKMVHFVWRVQDIVKRAVKEQQGFVRRFCTAAKAKVKTLLLHNAFMDIIRQSTSLVQIRQFVIPNNQLLLQSVLDISIPSLK
jgi:hypothetical protein